MFPVPRSYCEVRLRAGTICSHWRAVVWPPPRPRGARCRRRSPDHAESDPNPPRHCGNCATIVPRPRRPGIPRCSRPGCPFAASPPGWPAAATAPAPRPAWPAAVHPFAPVPAPPAGRHRPRTALPASGRPWCSRSPPAPHGAHPPRRPTSVPASHRCPGPSRLPAGHPAHPQRRAAHPPSRSARERE